MLSFRTISALAAGAALALTVMVAPSALATTDKEPKGCVAATDAWHKAQGKESERRTEFKDAREALQEAKAERDALPPDANPGKIEKADKKVEEAKAARDAAKGRYENAQARTAERQAAADAACTGPAGTDGTSGQNGTNGVDGKDGVSGVNGSSSTIIVERHTEAWKEAPRPKPVQADLPVTH